MILRGRSYGDWIEATRNHTLHVGDVVTQVTDRAVTYSASGAAEREITTQAELDSVPRGKTVGVYGSLAVRSAAPPEAAWVQLAEAAYMAAWRLGLKAVAVYRDGCKRSQPLSTSAKEDTSGAKGTGDGAPAPSAPPAAVRRRLPDERMARTHKFSVGGHEGYLHAGMYDDGTLGEIFVRMAKEGSTISGLMDAFATTVSLALQHGVPLQLLCDKFKHTRFEPSGWTGNQAIPRASSVTDYLFRWLESKFLTEADQAQEAQARSKVEPVQESAQAKPWRPETDAPTCHDCGTIMTRSGACHKCPNCGSTSGCS
jgi:ribonucleoside-diphosphate reductase alpha chain